MMKSSDYWASRAAQVEFLAEKASGATEAEIRRQYEIALEEVQKEIATFYAKNFKDGKPASYDAVKGTRLAELEKNISNIIKKLGGAEETLIGTMLKDTFVETFKRSVFDVFQHAGIGRSFTTIPTKQIEAIMNYPWSGMKYSERVWRNQANLHVAIMETLTQGFVQGKPIYDMAEDLGSRMDVAAKKAIPLIRTESNYITGQARKKAYEELGIKTYRIVATLDLRTSEICQKMDGKEFPVAEITVGKNYPPFHPNCRTITISAEHAKEMKERIARGADGKTYKVPADMTYEEWAKQYGTGEAEQGISGKHKGKTKENTVDLEYIESKEYRKKFDAITENQDANEAIYKYSKAILYHRTGSYYEDLYLIDGKGSFVAKETKAIKENAVSYSKKTEKIIQENPHSLIAIHNHGTNNPPTGSDFVSAGYHKYQFGVVVCHNGEVFTYRVGKQSFRTSTFGKTVDKYKGQGYNEYDSIIKTLEDYSKQYGIEWRRL